jgi:hypothetical protein
MLLILLHDVHEIKMELIMSARLYTFQLEYRQQISIKFGVGVMQLEYTRAVMWELH